MALPRGQQKGIHGPVVCVPSNISTVTQILPRHLEENTIVKVKLKRKMEYKGYHLYQQVSLPRLQSALQYLKENSPHFTDITLDMDAVIAGEHDGLVEREGPSTQSKHEAMDTNDSIDTISTEQVPSSPTLPCFNDHKVDTTDTDVAEEIAADNSGQNDTPITSDNQDRTVTTQSQPTTNGVHEDDIHDTSTPMVSCLQPEDLASHVNSKGDVLFSIAPAQGNRPGNVFEIETKAFPYLFPHGSNGYLSKRSTKLGFGRYINTRLFSADSRFASDPQYIFYSQYVSELKRINSSVSIAMRKGSPSQTTVTASVLKDQTQRENILKSNQGYHFLSNTRGSPAYWERTLRDLFAMVRQLGTPTWFCSFSAADRRWPEIVEAICRQQGKTVPENMDWSTYTLLINSNPVTACRMFEHRVQCFINKVILSPAIPIGKVVDYFLRTEFQSRGWPHIHCLFWCEDAPKFDDKKPNDSQFVEYINKYITCDIPDKDEKPDLHAIISCVQMHSKGHSPSCRKGGRQCRFNFPRPPSARTFVATPTPPPPDVELPVYQAQAQNLLNIVWQVTDKVEYLGLETAQKVLDKVKITQENYELAHCALTKRNTVIFQRDLSDTWVNPYNETLLLAWNGNMDIQPVLDAYSCIMYIVSYITKSERELGDLLKRCQKESLQGNLQPIQQLRTLGNVYLNAREISIMEAIYRSCGMNLKQCSRTVTFIPTDPDAVRITKTLKQLQPTDEGRDLWMTGIPERYFARPATAEFEDMCLAEFASQYQTVSGHNRKTHDDEEENCEMQTGSRHTAVYQLANNLGVISKKQKQSVIRYTRFNKEKNTQKYFFTLLRLYFPHRELSFTNEQNYEKEFQAKADVILPNMAKYETLADEIDDAWQLIQQGISTEDAWSMVAPNQETQRAEDEQEMRNLQQFNEDSEEVTLEEDNPDLMPQTIIQTSVRETSGLISKSVTCNEKQHRSRLQSMNKEQRELFYFIRDWAKQKERGETPPPFHIFLTGGAGTGKSHLIKCIYHEIDRIITRKSGNPDLPVILLLAYTGTAAFNINGQTIHSALSIAKAMNKSLGEDQANTLRCHLQDLQLVIIDEVSMVSAKLLELVHCRLQQIKQPSTPNACFGNIPILAVGDFYQTPPVGAKTLLSNKSSLTDLWKHFYKWELKEIIRQQGDVPFMQMLNRIRTKEKSEQLTDDDKALLQSRIVTKDDLSYPQDALHVAATHAQLDVHNNYMMDQLPQENQRHELFAADTCTDRQSQKTFLKKDPVNKQGVNLPSHLTVCVGARVMLTANIDVKDGLTNGALGTVTAIVIGKQPLGLPEKINIKFDNDSVGRNTRQKQVLPANVNHASTCIKPHTEIIDRKPTITRHQYPFMKAWAVTIHKVQGMTTQHIVVSLSRIFKPGMAYVALSRATSIEGLFLLGNDYDEQTIYCDSSIHQALQTMPSADTLPQWLQPVDMLGLRKTATTIIACHNIEGFIPHINDFTSNIVTQQTDIIALQETWISQTTGFTNPLPNHTMYLMARNYPNLPDVPVALQTAEKGGVAMFIHADYSTEQIPTTDSGIECLAVKVNSPEFCIYNVYRPPLLPLKYFVSRLLQCLAKSPTKFNVVLGDFNVNLLTNTSVLNDEMTKLDYKQIINRPTTAQNTLIDHIYITKIDPVASGVIPTYYSYHDKTYLAF